MGKERTSYTAKFKLQVVQYAKEHGKREAGRKFDVNEKNVRRWCESEDKLVNCSKSRRAFRGQKCKYPDIEKDLLNFIIENRKSSFVVTTEMIQVEGCKLARNRNIPSTEFKVSYGWVRRFMVRNNLSVRRRTTIAQKLPESYENSLLAFQRHIIKLRRQHCYLLSQMGNADQTPVYFDMPSSTTVNNVGERSVQIRSCGAEKQRCTVMLSVTADGRKLPPYVVFDRKTLPKRENFPPGIILRAREGGWMTEELVLDWVSAVWTKRPGALLRTKSMLVMDSFRGHTGVRIKKHLQQEKCDLVIIPGGMTSVLQPLDVCINRPFKRNVRQYYREYLMKKAALTPGGRLQRASVSEVCRWILAAWRSIPEELVAKSFKKTGISNHLDGTEDELLYNDSDQQSESSSEGEETEMSD